MYWSLENVEWQWLIIQKIVCLDVCVPILMGSGDDLYTSELTIHEVPRRIILLNPDMRWLMHDSWGLTNWWHIAPTYVHETNRENNHVGSNNCKHRSWINIATSRRSRYWSGIIVAIFSHTYVVTERYNYPVNLTHPLRWDGSRIWKYIKKYKKSKKFIIAFVSSRYVLVKPPKNPVGKR
jgi:hypothetical protein